MSKGKKTLILISVVLLLSLMLSSCNLFGPGDQTTGGDSTDGTLPYSETSSAPDSSNTTAPDTDETTSPETGVSTGTSPVDTTGEVTTEPVPVQTYLNPLTGLEVEKDLRRVIPISIVLDNLSLAVPQSGISRADIVIEVLAEGGITRLIMITNDYGGSEVYGPVRSTRHYMVSLSQAFGTLMVGAGGSPLGYTMIQSLGLPYLDGVNDPYSGLGFYRDPLRLESSGASHSLMTNGERILKLAAKHDWTTTTSSDIRTVFNFGGGQRYTGVATHVCIPYSSSQYVQMIYSPTTNTYYRYQLGDRAHIDAENGEQLNFTNVFILFAETESIPDDTEGRLDVVTTGEGSGYYISDGSYMPIRWSRIGDTSSFIFTDESGAVISVNKGKTFISVAPKWIEGQVELNYKAD